MSHFKGTYNRTKSSRKS